MMSEKSEFEVIIKDATQIVNKKAGTSGKIPNVPAFNNKIII